MVTRTTQMMITFTYKKLWKILFHDMLFKSIREYTLTVIATT